SGEYYTAFSKIHEVNPNYHFRFFTTNPSSIHGGEPLNIPIWLLSVDDIALLLSATTHTQISIIEKMMKLVKNFSQSDGEALEYKNHLIANAIMTILYSNQGSASKRDEIFSIFNTCPTNEFNLNATVEGIGYTRKLQECFLIDSNDQFSERVLLTEYITKFIKPELNQYEPTEVHYFTLADMENALNFALISEGWLRNENVYADAITLKVKLHELVISSKAKFFDCKDFVRLDQYLSGLIIKDNQKFQIININLEDVDDAFAKAIVKIFTRLIFEFSRKIQRGSVPFNILLEEAHRYVQKDQDQFLIGYNIFDRIAKEGRKYGVIMTLISQRPVDLSETVISQCSNFLIFKMSHPRDIEYITKMIPNITEDIIEKQKSLQIGNCLAFGSAFKIPIVVKLEMPNPMPQSSSCNVVENWTSH
ncbi:MAG: ATP-binding protein, partial [Bacilli bacterium]|nr:ATP-binding protein [Bacilli bacterium]